MSGDVINNERLCEIFGCSTQGGMRRSHKTNTLILVSNHIKSIYEDQWINDVFHYTGEGTTGDQSLDFRQNKTLRDSGSNGIDVHLFEVFRLKQYTYRGRVRLVDKPYQSPQLDQNGTSRNVWIFPLEIVGTAAPIAEEDLEHANQQRAIKVKSLTDEELLARIQNISPVAGTVEVKSQRRQRNHYVDEMAKRRANGVCQLCKNPAPFARVDGTPSLKYITLLHFRMVARIHWRTRSLFAPIVIERCMLWDWKKTSKLF